MSRIAVRIVKSSLFSLFIGLSGCGGGDDGDGYTIGGTIAGLNGKVVLQNNKSDDLEVTNNGNFHFPKELNSGDKYEVTVLSQPSGQICSVDAGSGTIGDINIDTITVSCKTTAREGFTIGGTVSGLSGTLELQINNGDTITIDKSGVFAFQSVYEDHTQYNITIKTVPESHTCELVNSSGEINGDSVGNIEIICAKFDLATPQNFKAKSFARAIRFSWDPVDEAEKYILYTREDYDVATKSFTYKVYEETPNPFLELYSRTPSSQGPNLVVQAVAGEKRSNYTDVTSASYGSDRLPELIFTPRNVRASQGTFSDKVELCWDYGFIPEDYYKDRRGAVIPKIANNGRGGRETRLTEKADPNANYYETYVSKNCFVYKGRTAGPAKFSVQFQNPFANKNSTKVYVEGFTAQQAQDNLMAPDVNTRDYSTHDFWDATGNIDAFHIYRETEEGSDIYRKYSITQLYNLWSLAPIIDYFPRKIARYKIRSVNEETESEFSDALEVKSKSISNITIQHQFQQGTHWFSWDESANSDKYIVVYSFEDIKPGNYFRRVEVNDTQFAFPNNWSVMHIQVYGLKNYTDTWHNLERGETVVVYQDADEDNVEDTLDLCANTENGEPVDTSGCSYYQRLDSDNDGIYNGNDQCRKTLRDEVVNNVGCSNYDLYDIDRDEVLDSNDRCENTINDGNINSEGCSVRQASDDDADGVINYDDYCPRTAANTSVDTQGCSSSQLSDADADGVFDAYDVCPGTSTAVQVNSHGCANEQLVDSDFDGIRDYQDQCQSTPKGLQVNAQGCAESELNDADGDGIVDAYDLCDATPANDVANRYGCSESQVNLDSSIPDFKVSRNYTNDKYIRMFWRFIPTASEYRVTIHTPNEDIEIVQEATSTYFHLKYLYEGAATVSIRAYYKKDGKLIPGNSVARGSVAAYVEQTEKETTSTTKENPSDGSSSSSSASTALQCAVIGEDFRDQYTSKKTTFIQNKCADKIRVAWCIATSSKANCGGDGYYPHNYILAPGQRHFNQFTLPSDVNFRIAACYGGRFFQADSSGRFSCPPE